MIGIDHFSRHRRPVVWPVVGACRRRRDSKESEREKEKERERQREREKRRDLEGEKEKEGERGWSELDISTPLTCDEVSQTCVTQP